MMSAAAAVNHRAGLGRIDPTSITASRVGIGWCKVWAGSNGGLNHWPTVRPIKSFSVLDYIVRILDQVYNRWMWFSEWRRVWSWWWRRCDGVNSAHQPPSEQQLTPSTTSLFYRSFWGKNIALMNHKHDKHTHILYDSGVSIMRALFTYISAVDSVQIYLILIFYDRCICDDCGVKRVAL